MSKHALIYQPQFSHSPQWSDEQRAIFDHFQFGTGNVVIKARAGTGKTTTAKHGFSLAPEERMLYAVFNKKNQREAEEKIRDPRVEVKTLHSVGFRCIGQHWDGIKPDDAVELDRLLAVVMEPPEELVAPILKLVGFAKNCFITPTGEDIAAIAEEKMPDIDFGDLLGQVCEVVVRILSLSKQRDKQNRISFNDMVWLPVALDLVHPRFDLVLVDEAQDMNLPQLTMAMRSSRGRVIVVGDDRQCIYGFRGAVHDGLAMMRDELDAQELGLTTTYRCPKKVVALAREFVPDYNAAPEAPDGIVDSISESQLCEQVKVGDAILSRANAPLMPLCLSLLRRSIPARIEGRDVGKALLATVRKMKAKSVPNFLDKTLAWAEKAKKRLLKKMPSTPLTCPADGAAQTDQINKINAQIDKINDQAETLVAVAEGCQSVEDIEWRVRNFFEDSDSNSRPAVVLSTVHKAKGLEWPRVFLIRGTFLKRRNREEENIYYVALTRAKSHLTFIGGEPL